MPPPKEQKKPQLTIDEYRKVQEKLTKSKLNLHFPPFIKWLIAIPATYILFLLAYFLFHVRFVAQH